MGWIANFNYRKSFKLNASVDGALSNYQVPVYVRRSTGVDGTTSFGTGYAGSVYISTNCEVDYDDIRFTTSDGETLLDYWIEYASASYALIWVELNSIPASGDVTFYIYYKYAAATAVSDGDATFILYEPWDSYDTGRWTNPQPGGCTVSGNVMSFYYGGAATFFGCTQNMVPPFRVRGKSSYDTNTAFWLQPFGIWNSAQRAHCTGHYDTDPQRMYGRDTDNIGSQQYLSDGEGEQNNIQIEYQIDVVDFDDADYILGSTFRGHTDYDQAAWGNYGIFFHSMSTSSSIKIYNYWSFQAKLTANEPTWGAWGSEESSASSNQNRTAIRMLIE